MTTITERLEAEVERMRAAMDTRVAADPPLDELVRELVERTEQARAVLDPDLRAAILAERARTRADYACESCGCDPREHGGGW